ncbi:uncharacterized protein LOC127723042 isoform X3 [Mytilus californianus]|uniref:uncharacterized protein LOC127723042 isoform X3 n=1 Tax=Mytilus californianus TaxID=6549 RepID=UPI0022469B54|nr:uncharacterized protein LOC127723042 isoform X3 [Mytilus californianus]
MPQSLAGVPPMVIGGSIISAVSLIFHIIGFSTTYWYRVGDVHMGLWKSCGKDLKGAEICYDITDAPVHYNQLVAAQVLECLALVAFLAAVTCAFLKIFVLKEQGMLFVVTGLLNWLAGGLALIGTIVFATLSSRGFTFDSSNFHYSFGLCIVGGIGGIFSGIVFTLAWRWVRN